MPRTGPVQTSKAWSLEGCSSLGVLGMPGGVPLQTQASCRHKGRNARLGSARCSHMRCRTEPWLRACTLRRVAQTLKSKQEWHVQSKSYIDF